MPSTLEQLQMQNQIEKERIAQAQLGQRQLDILKKQARWNREMAEEQQKTRQLAERLQMDEMLRAEMREALGQRVGGGIIQMTGQEPTVFMGGVRGGVSYGGPGGEAPYSAYRPAIPSRGMEMTGMEPPSEITDLINKASGGGMTARGLGLDLAEALPEIEARYGPAYHENLQQRLARMDAAVRRESAAKQGTTPGRMRKLEEAQREGILAEAERQRATAAQIKATDMERQQQAEAIDKEILSLVQEAEIAMKPLSDPMAPQEVRQAAYNDLATIRQGLAGARQRRAALYKTTEEGPAAGGEGGTPKPPPIANILPTNPRHSMNIEFIRQQIEYAKENGLEFVPLGLNVKDANGKEEEAYVTIPQAEVLYSTAAKKRGKNRDWTRAKDTELRDSLVEQFHNANKRKVRKEIAEVRQETEKWGQRQRRREYEADRERRAELFKTDPFGATWEAATDWRSWVPPEPLTGPSPQEGIAGMVGEAIANPTWKDAMFGVVGGTLAQLLQGQPAQPSAPRNTRQQPGFRYVPGWPFPIPDFTPRR